MMGWECIMEELGRGYTVGRATEGDTKGGDRGRWLERRGVA
jgi:hypothetical protein